MPKYKANRSFSIPDGKDKNGNPKMKQFDFGETYDLSEDFVRNIGGSAARPSFILVAESPKPKPKAKKVGEKKPDIRTRK